MFDALRWIAAGCFEAMVNDLRALLRTADGRDPNPTTVILLTSLRRKRLPAKVICYDAGD